MGARLRSLASRRALSSAPLCACLCLHAPTSNCAVGYARCAATAMEALTTLLPCLPRLTGRSSPTQATAPFAQAVLSSPIRAPWRAQSRGRAWAHRNHARRLIHKQGREFPMASGLTPFLTDVRRPPLMLFRREDVPVLTFTTRWSSPLLILCLPRKKRTCYSSPFDRRWSGRGKQKKTEHLLLKYTCTVEDSFYGWFLADVATMETVYSFKHWDCPNIHASIRSTYTKIIV